MRYKDYRDYIEYSGFVLTLCRFKIASEVITDWGVSDSYYEYLATTFIKTYKKSIDKYVPYWIENA